VAKGALSGYVFAWPGPRQRTRRFLSWTGSCVALGYGSLYNHSPDANLVWTARKWTRELVFWARRDIECDEQLTHDYGWADYLVRDFTYPPLPASACVDGSPQPLHGNGAQKRRCWTPSAISS
jgi:hypothetical protein